jgi:Uma2 family endonuclease
MVLRLYPAIQMTDDQFYEFCQLNRDFRIERNAFGELVIMPPQVPKLMNVTLT